MAADMRSTIARLTTFRCTWTAEEVAALTDTALKGARAYLSTLVHQRVLITKDGHFAPGPQVKAWLAHPPKAKGPSKYGNSRKYREERALWDKLRQRDWEVAKKAAKNSPDPTLTSQPTPGPITGRQEMPEVLTTSNQPALTLDEAASLLSVSLNTVRREVSRGKLSTFRVASSVRIARAEFDRYVAAAAIAAQGEA